MFCENKQEQGGLNISVNFCHIFVLYMKELYLQISKMIAVSYSCSSFVDQHKQSVSSQSLIVTIISSESVEDRKYYAGIVFLSLDLQLSLGSGIALFTSCWISLVVTKQDAKELMTRVLQRNVYQL